MSTSITGYFQDEDTKKWIKVHNGAAVFNPENMADSWGARLEDFIKIKLKTGVYKYFKK
ncbi:hypothetical protein [Neobacillus niacini]|uniref:hypothetical protein n=1 Tax=Neobacillus niacini TaxID=86668 RepID=UPI002FFEB2A2